MKEESREITVNGIDVTVYADGSIEKPNRRYRDNRLERQFGSIDRWGYPMIRIGGKVLRVHRLIAKAFLSNYCEELQVDHVNGDKANNRPDNLRMVTCQQNNRAFKQKRKDTSSLSRGVSFHKSTQKWQAHIMIDGKNKHIGLFPNESDAALAYNRAATEYGFASEALNSI